MLGLRGRACSGRDGGHDEKRGRGNDVWTSGGRNREVESDVAAAGDV